MIDAAGVVGNKIRDADLLVYWRANSRSYRRAWLRANYRGYWRSNSRASEAARMATTEKKP